MDKTSSFNEMRSHIYTVDQIRHENDMTSSLIMREPMQSEPGQFLLLWLPGIGEKPFSIAGNDPLIVTIADVGKMTHMIHEFKPGDRVWIRGPLGQGYKPYGKDALLVGGGYGASPLLLLAEKLIENGLNVQVFLGARTKDLLILTDQFRELPLTLHITTNDGSEGIEGFVTNPLEKSIQQLEDPQQACVYACGPIMCRVSFPGRRLCAAEWGCAVPAGLNCQKPGKNLRIYREAGEPGWFAEMDRHPLQYDNDVIWSNFFLK